MVEAASFVDLISGFEPAKSTPMVNLLQFSDGYLIFCGAEEQQLLNIKVILFCFEAVLGLKVNFFKSELLGVRLSEVQLEVGTLRRHLVL